MLYLPTDSGPSRRMLVALNWRNHQHLFDSLEEAYRFVKSELNNVETEYDDNIGFTANKQNGRADNTKKQGFKNIFQKVDNNHTYHLLISDESAASGSKSDTDIDI